MTKQEFDNWLEQEFAKHPLLARSNPRSLNELVYVLRMSEYDFNLSWEDSDDGRCTCVPTVKECFIPTRDLALKMRIKDYDEDEYDGVIYRHIDLEVLA